MNAGERRFHAENAAVFANTDDDLFMLDQLATGFANDDGLVDVFMTNGAGLNPGNRGPYKLFVNETETDHHHAILVLTGTRSNTDALGAQVELRGSSSELLGYRELGSGFNRSQSTHKVHFGLGHYAGALHARIRWPSGETSEHEVSLDATTSITEPSSR